jgi:DNA polymerase III subunit delta'
MLNMKPLLFPWQHVAWQQFQQLRQRLPHAILFHGPQGIGKTVFAEAVAQSLLCEAPLAQGHACGSCVSCGWFDQYSHLDYRRIRPEVLEESDDSSKEEDAVAEESIKTAKSSKASSKDIKIDQIRALADFMNVSTHRQGRRVVVLYPAEALNAAAANALLKTLEEPPPHTVFLLVSNSLDRLLPTILSRCRKFALMQPSSEDALHWLEAQGVKEAATWLAEQGGAPLAAHASAQSGAHENLEAFLRYLARPNVEDALKTADRLQKMPVVELVGWLQRWLYDIFSFRLAGKIHYYPRYRQALAALAGQARIERLLGMIKAVNERRIIAEHPLSPKLFIEDMLLAYATIFP